MRARLIRQPVAVAAGLALAAACSGPTEGGAGGALPVVPPEAVGYSSARLQIARAHFDRIGSAAFMALYDGKVFVAWGQVDRKYLLHSIRKPLLGALYGIAVGRGMIDTGATLASLGIDDIPPSLTAAERQARVIHLLKSQSGVYHEAAAETEDMVGSRPPRGSRPPGTFFWYNNWDFNALGTIYEQETGDGIFTAFQREIATPVGMQDFTVADGSYQLEPAKSLHPAYPIRMSARDLARFGVLFQQRGRWNGRQIIPESWIDASWIPYAVDDSTLGLGYGLMWGTIAGDSPLGVGPAVFHGGLAVHYLLIRPQHKLVLVHRVDTDHAWSISTDEIGELFRLVLAAQEAS